MRRVEIVDFVGQEPATPPDQKADSTGHLDESEQFQHSGHA
jgi:hypothetical protein